MKAVFFGTPSFAAAILEKLIDHGLEIVAIVTMPDRPIGRSKDLLAPPVKVVAQKKLPNVPLYQPPKISTPEYCKILGAHHADLFVVAAYGEILGPEILGLPEFDCINVHASLLPKYRGAAPMQRCLMAGDSVTGITIMRMAQKMDAGDILEVGKVAVPEEMTMGKLELEMRRVGVECLLRVMERYKKGAVVGTPQDHSLATYAPKIKREDRKVDWNETAHHIHYKIRAFTPHPGAWCFVKIRNQKKQLLLRSSSVAQGKGSPGEVLSYGKEGVVIACKEGAVRVMELQVESRRMMKAEEFCKGIPKEQLSMLC